MQPIKLDRPQQGIPLTVTPVRTISLNSGPAPQPVRTVQQPQHPDFSIGSFISSLPGALADFGHRMFEGGKDVVQPVVDTAVNSYKPLVQNAGKLIGDVATGHFQQAGQDVQHNVNQSLSAVGTPSPQVPKGMTFKQAMMNPEFAAATKAHYDALAMTIAASAEGGGIKKPGEEPQIPSAGDIAQQRLDQLRAQAASKGNAPKPQAPDRINIGNQPGQQLRLPIEPNPEASPTTTVNRPSADSTIKTQTSQDKYVPNAVAPEGQKLSRFANVTVQNSDKVDLPTKKLVDEKAISYTPQTVKAGQDFAEQQYGTKDLPQSTIEVTSHLSDAKPGTISRQDVFNAHKVAERLQQSGKIEDKAAAADIYARLSEHHTAAGQQIQAAAALAKQSPEGMLYSATKALKNNGVKVEGKVLDTVTNAIDEYKKALDDAGITHNTDKGEDGGVNVDNLSRDQADKQSLAYQKFVKTVNEQIPRKKGEAALSIWRAGLLTGPETAAKVAISHGITLPIELATKPVSALVDRATSLFTGKRGYTFRPSDLVAGAEGYGRGARAAGIKFKTGLDLPGTGNFPEKLGQRSSRQTLYEKVPTRLHAALAKPNFAAEHAMSLRSQAFAEAANQGLKGEAKANFIKDFIEHPSKEALDTAEHEAEHFTNQQRTLLGSGAHNVQSVPYVGTILAPFTRIPGAIGTKGLADWTPLGLAKGVTKIVRGIRSGNFDQRGFSQDIGRSITGTGVAVIGYELMQHGRMTLSEPQDDKERALWSQQGKQPNSIYIGGTVTKNSDGTSTYEGGRWITLNAFGPAGITLGLGGGYRDAVEQGKSGPAAVLQAAATGGKVLVDQPYLQGISGVANALNDPSRYAQTFLDKTVGSVVPAAVSQIARGTDDTVRAYSPSIVGTVKSAIPGLRETQPAALDTFGNPIPSNNGGSLMGGISGSVNPFYPSAARNQNDPVTHELQRLYTAGGSQNAPAFATPQKSMTINGQQLKLTPEQMNQYVGASGPLIHEGIANLLQNPDYQKLTDDEKTKQINDVITGARTAAKVSLFGDNPKTLSSAERAALLSPDQLGKDIQVPGLDLAQGVAKEDKVLLTKVYSMSSTEKTKYLNDPANKYQYDLASFHNDTLNGKYDSVQQFNKQNELAKQAVTSKYSSEVGELYGMGKAALTQYLDSHPDKADQLETQLKALDNELYAGGFESSLKFKNGVRSDGTGGSGKAKIQTAGASFGSTFPKLESLLQSSERLPSAHAAGGRRVSLRTFRPSGGGSRTFGSSSTKVRAGKVSSPPKPPKFPKPSSASISRKRVKLNA